MAPVVHECLRRSDRIEAILCATGQHRQMLDQVTAYFGIAVDRGLNLMSPNRTPAAAMSYQFCRIKGRVTPQAR